MNKNITEVVENQAADTAVTETANCGTGMTFLGTAVTMVVGYVAGKVVELTIKGITHLAEKRKKAKAIAAQPEEAIEVEVVE